MIVVAIWPSGPDPLSTGEEETVRSEQSPFFDQAGRLRGSKQMVWQMEQAIRNVSGPSPARIRMSHTALSHVRPGMDVLNPARSSGRIVKDMRSTDFLVNRRLKRDIYIPLEAIFIVQDDAVVLTVRTRMWMTTTGRVRLCGARLDDRVDSRAQSSHAASWPA